MRNPQVTIPTALLLTLLAGCGGGGGGGGSSSSGSSASRPQNLAYDFGTAVLLQQVDVDLVPTVDGNVTSWSISPALPDGLTLNPITGAIEGAALPEVAPTVFEVEASNSFGSDQTEITLAVSPAPRFGFLANTGDDTISQFTTDSVTGTLQFNGFHLTGSAFDGPEEVVLHPSGDFAFVPNLGDGINASDLSSYRVNRNTGQLTSLGTVAVGVGPHSLAVAPSGNTVYVSSFGSNEVQAFSVNATTGLLSPLGAPAQTGAGPVTTAVDPLGRFLYVGNETGRSVSIYGLDPATGMLVPPTSEQTLNGSRVASLAVSPDGQYVLMVMSNFNFVISWRIDPTTGALTVINSRSTGTTPVSLAIHPLESFVYVANEADGTFSTFSFDPDTGMIADLAVVEAGARPVSVTFDTSGLFSYVVDADSNEVLTFEVDIDSGTTTASGSVRSRQSPRPLAIATGPSPVQVRGGFVYVANRDGDSLNAYAIDPDTGGLTSLGPTLLTPGAEPVGVATDPLGRFLYSVQRGEGTARSFAIDNQTGALTPAGSLAITEPTSLAVDPSGEYIFVTNAPGTLWTFQVHPTSGVLSPHDDDPAGLSPSAVGVDPTGQFVYVTSPVTNTVRSFSVVDGILAQTGSETAPGAPASIRFSPFGEHAYIALPGANLLAPYAIDPVTGLLSVQGMGAVDPGPQPTAMMVHPRGLFGYGAVNDPSGNGRVSTLAVDPESGWLALLSDTPIGLNPRDLAIDPSGEYLFVINEGGNDISRFAIDISTGALEFLGSTLTGDTPYGIAVKTVLE